eukprot:TRINITY_DN99_c0_g3_i1.p3 TRINITY_DN99_c0_g3~~TRINITY_DN99_c0_g3_i1.p3  ORF type:complete len:106 (-),score=14.14 TRINITY_DN99_c0_g3_i1:90-407(-)
MAEQGAKLKAKAAAEAIANRMVQEHRENVLQVGQQNGSGVSGGVVGQQFHHDYKDKLNTKRKFQVEPPPDERWNEEPLRKRTSRLCSKNREGNENLIQSIRTTNY